MKTHMYAAAEKSLDALRIGFSKVWVAARPRSFDNLAYAKRVPPLFRMGSTPREAEVHTIVLLCKAPQHGRR